MNGVSRSGCGGAMGGGDRGLVKNGNCNLVERRSVGGTRGVELRVMI